jgi:hypothetical protein
LALLASTPQNAQSNREFWTQLDADSALLIPVGRGLFPTEGSGKTRGQRRHWIGFF